MGGLVSKLYTKIHQNGILPEDSQYTREKLIAFNWQIMICILVSFLFISLGIISNFYLLTYFAISYFILFWITFICITKHHPNYAKNFYLFTSNYAVFSISFCFGYEAGFYFYFFTTPLTVYITFDKSKNTFIYLALLTYLVNALALNIMHHKGLLINPGVLNDNAINILFNLNLFTAFFMIFMFIGSFMKINRLKTKEAEDLYQKQRLLEAEIHQTQLDEAKVQYQYQKLESEYQQLDMFNHIISHNLRGPISRVSGLLELLKQFPYTSADQQKLMEHLNSSVLMIDEVIKDLNYILVQKKLGQESIDNISFQEILEEVKLHLSEEIEMSGAVIREEFFIGKIDCIKGILISIFYNLISNSIKYSIPGRKPMIFITAEAKEHQMVLTFRDEGIGFDSEQYGEKLFRLYSRFHENIAGKGIGLFLVKSHVDMLDGNISVKSAHKQGTTFTICLPLKDTYLTSTDSSNSESNTEAGEITISS